MQTRILFLLFGLLKYCASISRTYENCAVINSNGGLKLYWTVDGSDIHIGFEGNYGGYIALGISTSSDGRKPLQCDIWAASSEVGDWYIGDFHVPIQDLSDGLTNKEIFQNTSYISGEFTRTLNVDDTTEDKPIILGTKQTIVWAAHSTSTITDFIPLHRFTGSASIDFGTASVCQSASEGTVENKGTAIAVATSAPSSPGTSTSPAGAFETPKGHSWTNQDGDFKVSWEVSADKQSILFLLEARTLGYVSIGLADHPTMPSTDCYVGWVESGAVYMFDSFAADYQMPSIDTLLGYEQSVSVVGGIEVDGWTRIAFRRDLDTGDVSDQVIGDRPLYIQWASHTEDGQVLENNAGIVYSLHNRVGASPQLNLLTGAHSFRLSDIFSPGWALLVLVGVVLLIFVMIRLTCKFYMCVQDKRRRRMEKRSNQSSTDMYSQSEYGQNTWDQNSYYRGSVLIQAAGVHEIVEDTVVDEESSGQFQLEMESAPPSLSLFSRVRAAIFWRVPRTHFTVFFLLIVFIYLGMNVGCYWLGDKPYTAIGSILAANLVLVMIPATRNSLFVWISGFPIDRTIIYHRWLGTFVVLLATLHVVLCYANWVNGKLNLSVEQTKMSNIYGLISWIFSFGIFFSSLEIIRRKKYEVFYYLHYQFIAFLVFGALHSEKLRPFVIFAAGIWCFDKFMRIMWGMWPTKTLLLKQKPAGMVQVVFRKRFFAKVFRMHKVGQFMLINFPGLSPLEWHPFSISSGPDETTVEVHIKARGDFTTKLVAAAQNKTRMWIRTDGPYGNHRINYRRFPVLILGAGGVGITPIIGILKDCYRTGDIDPKAKPHRFLVEKVFLVWAIQKMEQYWWFSDELNAFWEASQQPGMPTLELFIYVTRPQGQLDSYFFSGRPKFEGLFDRVVKEHPQKVSTVFACGPRQMISKMWDAVSKRKLSGHTFHFHHETFEF